MIQRIQSIWLLLSALCTGFVFLIPLATGNELQRLFVYGLVKDGHVLAEKSFLWGFALACTLLPLTVIFQFRKRPRQIRMIWLIALLNLVLTALALFEIFRLPDYRFSTGIIFLPVSFILLIMAVMAIRKDEKLVRSADRLR